MARKKKYKAKPKHRYMCRRCGESFESVEDLGENDSVCPKCINAFSGRKNK